MNRKRIKISRFTLVELLVAMGVFSVLLLVSMQIFSSSRRLWLNSERQNRAHADVRTAMEFITSRIQTQAYSDDMPFLIKRDAVNSKMYFPTAIPMNRKDDKGKNRDKNSMRFVGFSKSADGVLQMHIYSDEGRSSFQKNIPPYIRSYSYSNACTKVAAETINKTSYEGKEHNLVELMENVCKFELVPYTRKADADAQVVKFTGSELNSPPYRLDIKLAVMDSKENFDKWKSASGSDKTDLENEHCLYFTRTVLLNSRGAK